MIVEEIDMYNVIVTMYEAIVKQVDIIISKNQALQI